MTGGACGGCSIEPDAPEFAGWGFGTGVGTTGGAGSGFSAGGANVIGGSRLFQHLPEDRPTSRPHGGGVRHSVRVARQSKLHRLVEVETMEVVSRHHQALSSVGPDWSPCASDEENLIEAIEHVRHPFAIGVQWHPELSPEGHPNDRLFRGLVGAAGVFAGARRTRSRRFMGAV